MNSVTIPQGVAPVEFDFPPAALPDLLLTNAGTSPAFVAILAGSVGRGAPGCIRLPGRSSVVMRNVGATCGTALPVQRDGSLVVTRVPAGAFGRFPAVEAA